jgi:hypothetical protein
VDVQRAQARQVDDVARQDVAVRDDDGDVGCQGTNGVGEFGAARPLRLEHRDGFLERDLLDRRRDERRA